jgi:acetyl esterase/lipase
MIRPLQVLTALVAAFSMAALTGCHSLVRQGRDALGLGPRDENVHRNIVYARPGGTDLMLDLYVPPSPRPAPVVLWFHGGAWRYGTKEFNFHLRDLTRQGFAVATVQYRKIGAAPWPGALQDAEAGLAWLRLNAPRYGLDPNRVFLTGESAGGHLAAVLASKLGRSQVRAVCLLYAPTDLETLWKKYDGFSGTNQIFVDFFGRDEQEGRKMARTASPVALVGRSMPPTLMIHGDNDWIVPVAQSEALHTRLRELGVESKLIVIKGQNHAFPLTAAQVAEVGAFFKRRL